MKGTNFSGMSTSNSFRSMNATSAVAGSGIRVCNGKYATLVRSAYKVQEDWKNYVNNLIATSQKNLEVAKKMKATVDGLDKNLTALSEADKNEEYDAFHSLISALDKNLTSGIKSAGKLSYNQESIPSTFSSVY